jgi:hypothetical protein
VDVKRASESVSDMAVATVLVQLEVDNPPQRTGEQLPHRKVTFELSKQALETLIDGLSKIKTQLNDLNKQ